MMTQKLIAVACLLTFNAVPVLAGEGEMDKAHQDPGMRGAKWQFSELDANRDNKLSKQELTEKGVNVADFEQADSNADGALDQEEFVAISAE